ncbi:GntR family transcriptional regulator [Nocardia farcinica]|uniref:Carbon starvation induced regulator n=4 Tax=Nocardia TaxID=1817 RepID=A0A0H5NNI1_NOCFR|nr:MULTISPECIES: GntR family transcriptional regulator [Nocardia]AXK85351.1 GntR family transcriptional regulator [Nocardia farcinica]MBA4857643.1 GntR family transcriptional regulator [Nocardia farcinica]MBC9817868.1 GntR family transcriptional regulator [Nocardia farcinica]MBF6068054.1 GntR family transcriptional regulator [Nocardia farcinica]MBF6140070.1 GntR family transcriptional regulator [Nocardia farcinica]
MTTSKTSAASAPELAYEWLKNTILTLPRDEEMFLSEAQVAAASGTSRTPVREALLRLEAEGFIRRVPHKGAYIPALTDKDVDDVMQARRVVEEWSIAQVAPNPGQVPDRLRELLAAQDADTDPVEFIAHDLEFHTTVIRAAGNQVMHEFYRSLRDRQMRMGVRIMLSDERRKKQVLVEHGAIVDALAAGDTEAAIHAVREHLDTTLCSLKQPRF